MMNARGIPLRLKLQVSRRGIVAVATRPRYNALFYAGFWLTLGLLVWITNWRVLVDFVSVPGRGITEKILFFSGGYTSLVTNFSPSSAALLIIFALLSGLSAALLIFVMSVSFKETIASGSKNIVSIAAATLGAGCAACGTSFLAPFLTGLTGTASLALTMVVGVIANAAGLLLLGYSVYKLGITAASLIAKEL